MSGQPLIVVGEVSRPHGLAGEFSVITHVDSPAFLGNVPRLYLRHAPAGRATLVQVAAWRMHKSRLLLKLAQFSGRDQVEALRGAQLLVREQDLPRRAPDDIFFHELIGVRILLPSGEVLGCIEAVREAAGQELWSIRGQAGTEILFPVHEQFLLEVDMAARTIRIDPPKGLIDLYLG
jgi:16S rRNA processing protein RimM